MIKFKMPIILTLALSLMTLGAGCKKQTELTTSSKATVSLPKLDILAPGLNSTTKENSITISGTTDQPRVWLGAMAYEVREGNFAQKINLVDGMNNIPVTVGNSLATTTINITIEKLNIPPATTSTPSAVEPEKKPEVAVKTGTTKIATKKPAPTKTVMEPVVAPPQPSVVFSSSEMALGATLLDGKAHLSWTQAATPFQTYVIVKSTSDPKVYFPKQFWVRAINDIDVRAWIDVNVAAKTTTYYRVCKLEPDQSVVCGSVAKVVKL